MTNSKTRVRVARIAAGAVFAVGLSLTGAGAASAVGISLGVGNNDSESGEGGTLASVTEGQDSGGTIVGVVQGNSEGSSGDTSEGSSGDTSEGSSSGETSEGSSGDTSEGSSGGDDGGSSGGEEPATIGGSGGGGDDTPTCELNDSEVDCEEPGNTNPDVGGSQPVGQEQPQQELAETGAVETTFLLVGAATMIAGGVGFRMMPRLVSRGGGASAA